MYEYRIGRSKSGLPVLAESGGGATNTGAATIVCGRRGERLRPLFQPSRLYANGDHAIFALAEGYHIVEAHRARGSTEVTVYQIKELDLERGVALCKEIGWRVRGEENIPHYLRSAVDAAEEKARCYHCRCIHFIAG